MSRKFLEELRKDNFGNLQNGHAEEGEMDVDITSEEQ
jgi:hypothetical protein